MLNIYMDAPEFTGDDELFAAQCLVSNLDAIKDHRGYEPCGHTVQTGPLRWGVLAFNVCGLRPGHDGNHRAGWTDTGQWF